MNVLQQIKTLLTEQIAIYQPSSQSFGEIQISLNSPAVDLLTWLKAQTLFPQFYFEQRKQEYVVATIGAIHTINDFTLLTQLKQEYPTFNFIGGVKFAGEIQFILPRLYLECRSHQVIVKLFIDHRDWSNERQKLSQDLALLTEQQPLTSISQIKPNLLSQSSDQQSWQQLIQNALIAMQKKQFAKVVLAQEMIFQLNKPLNAFDFLAASRLVNHHCYHFILAETADNIFLGASPECLYQRSANHFHTEALAGTAPIGETAQQQQKYQSWLLQDPKNLEENQFVVDDICHRLAPYCTEINIEKVQLRQLRKVQHLCHPIHATLAVEYTDWEPLFAIHPTAAVAGYPKQAAMDFITHNEPFKRNWYAGAIGVISQNFAELCVGLRSAKVTNTQLHLFAGAGIVKESKADEEWLEIERKMSGLLSLFEIN